MTRPRKAANKPTPPREEPGSEAEVIALAGLPVAGEKAALVLGMKLTGQWTYTSASSLARRWNTSDNWVRQLAARVDEALEQLAGKEPARRLVMHQLLLALSEVDQIADAAKRVAARAKVCAEIAKVTGLVKGNAFQLPSLPTPLSDQLLEGTPAS